MRISTLLLATGLAVALTPLAHGAVIGVRASQEAQILPAQWTEQCRSVRRGDRVERKCQPMWIGPDRSERHNRRRSDGGADEHDVGGAGAGASERGGAAGARDAAGAGPDRPDFAGGRPDGPMRDAPPRGDPPARDRFQP